MGHSQEPLTGYSVEGGMGYKGLGLFAMATGAQVAPLPVRQEKAVAREAHCQSSGTVPGSITIFSSNAFSWQVSGHTVVFQLCRGVDTTPRVGSDGRVPGQPGKIGLPWQSESHPAGPGFSWEE